MKLNRIACAVLVIACLVFCSLLFAETPAKPAFEVASVKPLPPIQTLMEEIQSGKRSIASVKATVNDSRVDIGASAMMELLSMAYKLRPYQIIGPDWLYSENYEIHAKLPEGASKDQVPQMMQSLLSERFKIVAHRENNEQPVYALVVSKGGHKMKDAAADTGAAAPADKQAGEVSTKMDGRDMVMTAGNSQIRMAMDESGSIHMEQSFSKIKMSELAQTLSMLADRPVVDMTELTGSYQLSMEIPMAELTNLTQKMMPNLSLRTLGGGNAGGVGGAASDGVPSASDPSGGGIFRTVQKLGLKLESRKAPVETLVIESIEKTPTED